MKKLLLHVCCAPCAPYVFKVLQERFAVTGFFCNPNIQPAAEYLFRRSELEKVQRLLDWHIVFPEYDPAPWFDAVRGLESEPERGRRCPVCFRFRLRQTFAFAAGNGFDYVATTLSISPYKKSVQINDEGQKLATEFGIEFLAADFKKRNGQLIGGKMARDLGICHQHYCGCEFSLAETRKRQAERGS